MTRKDITAAVKKPANSIVITIIEALEELKAVDVTIMDLREIYEASTDFFIICNGTSSTHIGGLADRVKKNVLEQLGERPLHVEGKLGRNWLLLDYFNVVVHIFDKEKREFYDVEHLWSDAKIQKI